MAGVGRGDAAALLETAPEIRAVQHHLADELSLQADGEIHGAAGGKIRLGGIQKVVLRQRRISQTGAVVIAPPAVAVVVQTQGVIRLPVAGAQGRQGQALGFQCGYAAQHIQLRAYLQPHLAAQRRREVLQLGGTQPLVPGVVLPVDPRAAVAVVGGEGLHDGGIRSGVGV